tara:strand:+ start:6475 stop:6723 length:249 start_codon:yes stop_codon:yes gene_type:complete
MEYEFKYGTAFFPTIGDAYKYYWAQGIFGFQVDFKVKAGEIHIGEPPLPKNSTKIWAIAEPDQGGSKRYFIYEKTKPRRSSK